jgi:hypothetical protein
MINRCFLFALLAVQAVTASGQPPRDQKGKETPQNPVQLRTQLVEVTAVITDKRGQPVRGLTKDDFELRENGKPLAISLFSAGGIGTGEDGGKPSSPAKPKEISEPTRAAPLRSVVIFGDSLNMSAGAAHTQSL